MAWPRCKTCGQPPPRTIEQNRHLWKIQTRMERDAVTEDGRYCTKFTWHEHCAGLFLGFKEVRLETGQIKYEPVSTSSLNMEQFARHIVEVEQYANTLGAYLDDHDDYPF